MKQKLTGMRTESYFESISQFKQSELIKLSLEPNSDTSEDPLTQTPLGIRRNMKFVVMIIAHFLNLISVCQYSAPTSMGSHAKEEPLGFHF